MCRVFSLLEDLPVATASLVTLAEIFRRAGGFPSEVLKVKGDLVDLDCKEDAGGPPASSSSFQIP